MFSIQLSIQLSVDQQLPRFRPTSCPPNRSYIPFMFLIMAQSCREETSQISGFSYLYFFKNHRKAMAMNLAWCILSLPRHICVVRPCWFKYYCSFFIWYIISVWFSVLFIFCDILFLLCWKIPKKYYTYISATSLLCTRMLVVYKL